MQERQRNADEVTHLNEEIGLLQSSHDHQKKVCISSFHDKNLNL